MLVMLLRKIGVPPAPVIVSSTSGKTLHDALPATHLFDHVIVHAQVGEAKIWIDPTASPQAGPITTPSIPPYTFGLQVSPKANKLSGIPRPDPNTNQLTITEHFIIAPDHSATLNVSTRAAGIEADRLRAEQDSPSITHLRESFPNINPTDTAEVSDDPEANLIVIKESFHIPSITSPGSDRASFVPAAISHNLPTIPTRPSDHPIALNFPCNLRQVIVIDTPTPAPPSQHSEQFPGAGFALSLKTETQGQRHTLRYAYDALDDHLTPADQEVDRQRLSTIKSRLDYQIQFPQKSLQQEKHPRQEAIRRLRNQRRTKPPANARALQKIVPDFCCPSSAPSPASHSFSSLKKPSRATPAKRAANSANARSPPRKRDRPSQQRRPKTYPRSPTTR